MLQYFEDKGLNNEYSGVFLRSNSTLQQNYITNPKQPDQGVSTQAKIMNDWQIIKKWREFNIPVVKCFIDYTKVFGYMNWKKLFKAFRRNRSPCPFSISGRVPI